MKTLEQRLFHLFPSADVAKARTITPASVACPRVGQVRATVVGDDGDEHEVQMELSAHRRGGMTLETHCTTTAGRAGLPCAVLAAVLLEVDRRRLLSGIHDQTPVTLNIVADDIPDAGSAGEDEIASDEVGDGEGDDPDRAAAAEPTWTPPPSLRRGGQRLPAWATELEERRRLVEPAVRAHGLSIPDPRRAGGALVFLLDLSASSEARAAVLVPARMQLDLLRNRILKVELQLSIGSFVVTCGALVTRASYPTPPQGAQTMAIASARVAAAFGARGLLSVSVDGIGASVQNDAFALALDGVLVNSSSLADPAA